MRGFSIISSFLNLIHTSYHNTKRLSPLGQEKHLLHCTAKTASSVLCYTNTSSFKYQLERLFLPLENQDPKLKHFPTVLSCFYVVHGNNLRFEQDRTVY